jgi:AraC-like DNA-binding protein
MWRGGAATLRSSTGPDDPPDPHIHFAIQLTIGVSHELSLRRGPHALERWAPGWMVGSDQPHWMHGRGTGVTIFLDPLSAQGQRIAARLGGRGAVALSPAEYQVARHELEDCWQRGWLLADVRAAVDRVVDLLAPEAAAGDSVDRRVRAVIDDLVQDLSENTSLAELAAKVGLSESRLAHLFRRDVGIPMRQYRLTLRMEQAVRHIALGSSLTEAAHSAGFSDSAHFCRICRRMFGSAPSDLPEFEAEG